MIESKPSKQIRDRREQLERDVAAFKAKGGKVKLLDELLPSTEARIRFNAGCKD